MVARPVEILVDGSWTFGQLLAWTRRDPAGCWWGVVRYSVGYLRFEPARPEHQIRPLKLLEEVQGSAPLLQDGSSTRHCPRPPTSTAASSPVRTSRYTSPRVRPRLSAAAVRVQNRARTPGDSPDGRGRGAGTEVQRRQPVAG